MNIKPIPITGRCPFFDHVTPGSKGLSAVVKNPIEYEPDTPSMTGPDQLSKILLRSEGGIYSKIILRIVLMNRGRSKMGVR